MRTNERIRVREIRVIDETGQQLGIMPPPQALVIAKQKGLDLVEISPACFFYMLLKIRAMQQKWQVF